MLFSSSVFFMCLYIFGELPNWEAEFNGKTCSAKTAEA